MKYEIVKDSDVWFRGPITEGLTGIVDLEKKIIHGFSVAEIGIASGHGEELDDQTLDDVVTLANKLKMGAPQRFGHPNMSTDSLGDWAGRAKNFRRDGDKVIADAHFSDAAFLNPSRIADNLFVRAESDPTSFATSMVIRRDLAFRLNEDGTRQEDDSGEVLPPLIRPTMFLASDFVDSGAATSGLFSTSDVTLSSEATVILDRVLSKPDAVERLMSFLERYKVNSKQNVDSGDQLGKSEGDGEMAEKEEATPGWFTRWRKGEEKRDSSLASGSLARATQEDVDKASDEPNYMKIAAQAEIKSFVDSQLNALNLTPGVRNTTGLAPVLEYFAAMRLFSDRERKDDALISSCSSLYAVADSVRWDDSKMTLAAVDLFPCKDPFGVVMKALSASPSFLADKSVFQNFAHSEGVGNDAPRGGGQGHGEDGKVAGMSEDTYKKVVDHWKGVS